MSKNENCFGNGDATRTGVYKLNTYASYVQAGTWWQTAGQEEYLTPGTYSWVCPPGVKSISAVCVGGGGGGRSQWANPAGGGGGLGWKNNIPVIAGQSYTVYVGENGHRNSGSGQNSYFINTSTVAGGAGGYNGGGGGSLNVANNNSGGGYSGDGGGRGGHASHSGGGGAGGYSGNGGGSGGDAASSSGGGGGGQQYSSTHGTGAGGGVGIYGRRTDYTAKAGAAYSNDGNGKGTSVDIWNNGNQSGLGGQGGSRRTGTISGQMTGYSGCNGENPWGFSPNHNDIQGGFPGGGGGGPGTSHGGGNGADGAVRLMWGGEITGARSYPDTNCEDQT